MRCVNEKSFDSDLVNYFSGKPFSKVESLAQILKQILHIIDMSDTRDFPCFATISLYDTILFD